MSSTKKQLLARIKLMETEIKAAKVTITHMEAHKKTLLEHIDRLNDDLRLLADKGVKK